MSPQINVVGFNVARELLRAARGLVAVALGVGMATAVLAQGTNRLESIESVPMAGEQIELRLHMSNPAPQPLTFTVDNPARISLDLPDTTIALPSRRIDIKRGPLDTVTAAEANGRTRVVLNLDTMTPYETRVTGNMISVLLGGATSGAVAAAPAGPVSAPAVAAATRSASPAGQHLIKSVDFRGGGDGSGRVIVELSDSKVAADLRQEGGRIVVTFAKTSLPEGQMRRLDVVDFATPVSVVDVVRVGDASRLLISASGDWEQIAYQSDNIYTIEIKPVVKSAYELEEKKEFTGERLTLNFQDIETRAVLQLLADTSGQDMVISDSVTGNVTLRLNNVPWDQALDIVMRTKGLDMRRQGNVILVAPANEIASREKEVLAARKEVSELAPLRTEYLQVNYAKAADLAALIKSKSSSLLSERGNVAIDERTNTLLLQDTSDRLADIRRLVSTLDIPVRQVQIEARVVIVTDDFSRELGVRWGYTGIKSNGQDGLFSISGSAAATTAITNSAVTNLASTGSPYPVSATLDSSRYMVNLPTGLAGGSAALAILGSDYLVDLELSAAQAEGRGEIVSSPRVITANQKEASIEQGIQIPYVQSASSGATTVAFKDAVLSLKVTPQITPDDRIILDLAVNKDTVGQVFVLNEQGFRVPGIDTRKIRTQVLVDDGQTVVLGGIMETENRDDIAKVPWLGDIPVLGHLFKNTSKTNNKRELLIFVTPKILRESNYVK